jgi:hypothetical protein
MAKERQVTRTVIDSKVYDVYKKNGLNLEKLETIEAKGKVSEKELAEKHKVDKVFLDCVEEKKITYGMPVSEFMKYAKVVEDESDKKNEPQEQETATK